MQITPKIAFITAFTCALAALAGCGKSDPATERKIEDLDQRLSYLESKDPELIHQAQLDEIKELFPDAQQTESGLHYIVTEEGTGDATPARGQMVTAHYTGTLLSGEKFDSSVDRGQPFSFPVGAGRVIKGWDEAFLDMKKGEKRTLVIPARLGYGSRDMGQIPPNSILVFDVELLDFK